MVEAQLQELESKIDELIQLFQKVKLENASLRKKISQLNDENIALLVKNKKAAESIKGLILQLKDELSCQTQN